MRGTFKTEGGIAHFPGLSKPLTIDSDQLSQEEASELDRLVVAARLFDLPAVVGAPPRGAADYHQYTITVEASGRRHTVRLIDPVENPDLQRLLDYLRTQAKALRAAARASG